MMSSVAPLAGAWIEINPYLALNLPRPVAPLAGAWIEISKVSRKHSERTVAPLAGAWIEIDKLYELKTQIWSLPSRERGLK